MPEIQQSCIGCGRRESEIPPIWRFLVTATGQLICFPCGAFEGVSDEEGEKVRELVYERNEKKAWGKNG